MIYKNLVIALITIMLAASCKKNQQKSACGTQVCSDIFAVINVRFTDKQGNPITVQNYSVFDVSSGKQLYPGLPTANLVVGYYTVASDGDIKDFSNDGDNIRVSATDPATGQTKTANFKISGGCNCHVSKISGPDTVVFD